MGVREMGGWEESTGVWEGGRMGEECRCVRWEGERRVQVCGKVGGWEESAVVHLVLDYIVYPLPSSARAHLQSLIQLEAHMPLVISFPLSPPSPPSPPPLTSSQPVVS